MQAHLKLVEPDALATSSTASIETIEPSVLTASFSAQMRCVTEATRELRAMGLHVLNVTWAKRPVLRIAVEPSMSIAPLLDRMRSRRFVRDGSETDVYGDFNGVTVWWRLPAGTHPARQSSSNTTEH
jgi:hypothetical protein